MGSSQKVVEGSKPVYQVKVEKDVYITMRDGVRLAADIFRPDAEASSLRCSPMANMVKSWMNGD